MENVPKKYHSIVERAREGRSRVDAIQSHCLRCVNWLREEVRKCTDKDCFFWLYRPYGAPDKTPHRISGSGRKREMQRKGKANSNHKQFYTHFIKNPSGANLRLTVAIEPESENKEK